RPKKRVSYKRKVGGRDAEARVFDLNHERAALDGSAHLDFAVLGELDRVREEIDQDLFERPWVGNDVRQIRLQVDPKRKPGLFGVERQHLGALRDHRTGRKRLKLQLGGTRVELGHVQNSVNERQKVMSGRMDELGVITAPRCVELQRMLVDQH